MILQLFYIFPLARMAHAVRRDDTSTRQLEVPYAASIALLSKAIQNESYGGRQGQRSDVAPGRSPAAFLNLSLHSPELQHGRLEGDWPSGGPRLFFEAPPDSSMTTVDCILGRKLGAGAGGEVRACCQAGAACMAVKFNRNPSKSSRDEYDRQRKIQDISKHVVKASAAFVLPEAAYVQVQPEQAESLLQEGSFVQPEGKFVLPVGGEVKEEPVFFQIPAGTLVIVMEMLTGGDMSDMVFEQKFGHNMDLTMHVWLQVVDGVTAVHEAGFMYRDLKPENTLLASEAEDIEVKISDFGLCAERKVQTDRALKGTAEYLSPEQVLYAWHWSDKAYNELIDVWALGILLHEMFYGTHPFIDAYEDEMKAKNKGNSLDRAQLEHYTKLFITEKPIELVESKMIRTLKKLKKEGAPVDAFEKLLLSMLSRDPEQRPILYPRDDSRSIHNNPWVSYWNKRVSGKKAEALAAEKRKTDLLAGDESDPFGETF